MIHLDKPGLEASIEHDIKAENLEAQRILRIVRFGRLHQAFYRMNRRK